MTSKYFDPLKSFLHLKVVWGAIIFLAVLALVASIFIISNTRLICDPSAKGFNNFLSLFRFPLGMLGMIIPIVALLAANHRSEQTKEQIRVTGLQNNFSNYYKHMEEFCKYFESRNKPGIHSLNTRYIHGKIYPKLQQTGDFSICNELLRLIESVSQIPTRIHEKYPHDLNEEIDDKDKYKYIELITSLTSYLDPDVEKYKRKLNLENESKSYLIQSGELMIQIVDILRALVQACQFTFGFEAKYDKLMDIDFSLEDFSMDDCMDSCGDWVEKDFNGMNLHFKEKLRQFKAV